MFLAIFTWIYSVFRGGVFPYYKLHWSLTKVFYIRKWALDITDHSVKYSYFQPKVQDSSQNEHLTAPLYSQFYNIF